MKLDTLETFVFNSRLILVPLYTGLAVGLSIYCYKFLTVLWTLCSQIFSMSEEETMLELLSLVDITMVANLVIMIMIGGWSMFVRRITIHNRDERPQWLDHIDTNLLKIKMGMSLIGVSSISLLKSFINADEASWEIICKQIAVHLVFIMSTLIMALVYIRTQHAKQENGHNGHSTGAPSAASLNSHTHSLQHGSGTGIPTESHSQTQTLQDHQH